MRLQGSGRALTSFITVLRGEKHINTMK